MANNTDRSILCRECELKTIHTDSWQDDNSDGVDMRALMALPHTTRFKCKVCGSYNTFRTTAQSMTNELEAVYDRLDRFSRTAEINHDPFIQLELFNILGDFFEAIHATERHIEDMLEPTSPIPGKAFEEAPR